MKIKYICTGCLGNESLVKFVKENSKRKIKECPICGSKHKNIVDVSYFAQYLSDCITHNYSNLSSMDGIDFDSEREYYYIDTDEAVEITNIYNILEENEVLKSSVREPLRKEIYEMLFSDIHPKQDIYEHMAESGWSHAVSNDLLFTWETFNYLVQNNNRFFDSDKKLRSDYLEKIISKLDDYEVYIPKNINLYRVRNANELSISVLNDINNTLREISPAPCDKTKSFRMSPKGISYTYLSSDIETCLKECNIKKQDKILIGVFKTKKPLKILDLQIKNYPSYDLFSGKFDRERENINRFFDRYCLEISKPVENGNEFDYLLTQVIAEYIRFKGYDGIAYSSAKTKATNYVFFYGPDYHMFRDIRPKGWNLYIDSVPRFTQAFELIGGALCELTSEHPTKLEIKKTILDFKV